MQKICRTSWLSLKCSCIQPFSSVLAHPWCFIHQTRCQWKSPSLFSAHSNTRNSRQRCVSACQCVWINNVTMSACYFFLCALLESIHWHWESWPGRILDVKPRISEINFGDGVPTPVRDIRLIQGLTKQCVDMNPAVNFSRQKRCNSGTSVAKTLDHLITDRVSGTAAVEEVL